ncbi:hypothetical protein EHS25_004455 [Saitozyma podzolica]|uniref:Uncharacterized protein n=1 Tax=Saitozyma podzolica TaxID=1890683 RepID=A0A427YU51_9TREE|nr:hypothetical protein EHS25_004455 [Saitozyma podzolica]
MRASEVFDELEVVVEFEGRDFTEYETRFSPATPTSPPTFTCYLEADPDEAVHIIIRRHQAKRWTGDLMTDPVVDRKLFCTEYIRAEERVARHAVFPSLSRCQPWRPDEAARAYDHLQAERSIAAPEPYPHYDLSTLDELMVLHNGPSERLGTIEVSIWRGVFRSHSNICTTRETAAQSTWFNGSTDLSSASKSWLGSKSTHQQSFDKFDTFEDDHLYPWCRFIFRYGTRNMLIANGIVFHDSIDQDLEAALRALENPDLLIEVRSGSSPTRPRLEVQFSPRDPSPDLPGLPVGKLGTPLASETPQLIENQEQARARLTDPTDSTDPTGPSDSTDPPNVEDVDALQTALSALLPEVVSSRQPSHAQAGLGATPAEPRSAPEPPSMVTPSSPIDTSLLSNTILAPSRSINHLVPSKRPSPILTPCRDQDRRPSADPKRSRGQAQKISTRAPLRINHTNRATIPPESGTTCGKAQGQSARSKDASAVSASRRSQSDTKRRQAQRTDSPRTRKPARSKIDVNSRPPSWRDWKPTRYPAASRTNTSPNDRVRAQSLRAADRRRATVQVVPTPARPSRYIDLTIDDSDDDEEYAALRELSQRATGRTVAEAIDLT